GALQKALCIVWSQTHVPNSPTPTTPSPTPNPKPNPAAASAPSITAAPPPPPDKPSNDGGANNIRPPSANPSPSKTQNPAYTEGISSSSVTSSTITSATLASNTVSANLSTNQTSSDPTTTTTTTVDSGNFDNQTASNPAAKAMKFWIPLIGVIVLVLIVFTIASCLGCQFVRRRKLKKQLQRATLGSLEKGEELLNHCESTDALTSTMYYNGQVVPPIGTRIIPPEDQIKLDVNETQPEEIRYNSRSLTFPET
ncbi:10516_t:CDS:2, partial [Paraglomus occultum]